MRFLSNVRLVLQFDASGVIVKAPALLENRGNCGGVTLYFSDGGQVGVLFIGGSGFAEYVRVFVCVGV